MRFDWGLEGVWVIITGLYHRARWKWGEGFYECDCGRVFFSSDCGLGEIEEMGLGSQYSYGSIDDLEIDFWCAWCKEKAETSWLVDPTRYGDEVAEEAQVDD